MVGLKINMPETCDCCLAMTDIQKRIEACNTADGIDHGRHHVEDCLNALIEKYEDGYVQCVLTWNGGSCEECMELFEQRLEREEQDDD